jgi:hypothetical protein
MKLCAETSTIKRVLLRADMLQKVRKYDSKLSNVLQTFHVCSVLSLFGPANVVCVLQAKLTLDTRFAQIVDRREVGLLSVSF